jgi:hypothetical protein
MQQWFLLAPKHGFVAVFCAMKTHPTHPRKSILKKLIYTLGWRDGRISKHDPTTGIVTHQWWKNGSLDRPNGPAFILHNKATGIVTYEAWFKNGNKQGRDDGPAIIERDDTTGIVICEEWWKDGRPHRDDGPALIRRDGVTGIVTCEEWWKDGKRVEPSTVH